MKRYRRTKEYRRREMERLLVRLEEWQKTPAGAVDDKEVGELIAAMKKHLGKDDPEATTEKP